MAISAENQQPQEVRIVAEDSGPPCDLEIKSAETTSRTRKRVRNVSNACVNCQTRKVKCSGGASCSQCEANSLSCEYGSGRKRRTTSNIRQHDTMVDNEIVLSTIDESGSSHSDKQDQQTRMEQMLGRIGDLEAKYATLLKEIHSGQHATSSCSPVTNSKQGNPSPGTESSFATLPEKAFRGPTSLVSQFSTLDRSIAREPLADIQSRVESRAGTPLDETWINLPRGIDMALETIEKETRFNDPQSISHSVDMFFTFLNPHYPCLNENAFRPLFAKFMANEDQNEISYADRQQFIALVNLIHAEVRMLNDEWPTSARAPAWDEFCRAESILSRLTWLGNGDIMTIQCLLIKARYLIYAEKPSGAYDTMGRVVRLCWELGLNCQSSWTDISGYDIFMRQQIFWTCFYLDRHIAFITGAPYLMRISDIDVCLPPNLDNKLVFAGQPLPPVREGIKLNPYLVAATGWAKLASEVWDAIYSVNAQKPTSEELIATMDARIVFKQTQIADDLQWGNNFYKIDGKSDTPLVTIRQSAILNQRLNVLRLHLRQERILSLNFDDAMAADCVEIASTIINAIHNIHYSPIHFPLDRFSSCLSLVSSVLSMIGVIVKPTTIATHRSRAIEAYNKTISLLQEMAPTFSAARHALRGLGRLMRRTERAIRRFQNADQMPFDPDPDFEFDSLMPQMSVFFGHPYPQQDWDFDLLNGGLDGPFNSRSAPE